MEAIEIVLGIIVTLLAVAVIVCVLMQSGKDKSLSSTITGGASDSFFSKGKGKSKDKLFSRITTILTIVFAIVAVIMVIYVMANPAAPKA